MQYELVINARLIAGKNSDSCYGFYPALDETAEGPLFRIEKRENEPWLTWYSQRENGAWRLPADFDRRRTQQFRFRKCNGQIQVYGEAKALGSMAAPEGPARVGLYANRARVAFDLVRLTGIEGS